MKRVYKGWGWEKWIVNKPEYCGKLLFFEEGKKCSFHYHAQKDETFYLQSGELIVRYSDGDDLEESAIPKINPTHVSWPSDGMRRTGRCSWPRRWGRASA